ncbi:penicillin-binding protein 1A [Thiopseudomonas denitrificans]|uniref:Penicillin-binding protein 1A n=1 Tax=Thiopseudomonas denitrificans TaxID=1501432 RepID=A0A4R6TU00_9GAMM|nr:penicillin-binding protein 1A [Thiopseudomonas denitrificans]TDQ35483.1 penicillin-binding protein 1A [Thiopseudomonas denitrificans]
MILVVKSLFALAIALICGVVLSLAGAYLYLSPNLPSVESLRHVELQMPLRVYSEDDQLIEEFGEMRRTPIRFDEVPQDFINALLSAEDDNFTKHHGVDPGSLLRAAAQLVKTGRIQTGGSTITMQVAKNFFLTSERSFSRKANEILLALQIERELSKNEILELYVNKIYLGNRAYGIEAAANVYYGKSIKDLSLAQMAMLAGLPKAPSRYNPLANPARSMERRDWILGRMLRLGHIDQQQYEEAVNAEQDAKLHIKSPDVYAPYVAEMVRLEMINRYGSDAYTDGLNVRTTVPADLQNHAQQAVFRGLTDYDRRHGYRGPEARIEKRGDWQSALRNTKRINQFIPAIVSAVASDGIFVMLADGSEEHVDWQSMRWAAPFLSNSSRGASPRNPAAVASVGDLIRVEQGADGKLAFSQLPKIQASLVSLNPHDGAIRALVGGLSFEHSHYNRATQAQRQPGSSFKPFIYSAALDAGYTPATLINDAPIEIFEAGMKEVWRPKNSDNNFLGPIRLREGLYRSRNMVSIRILQDIGIPYTRDYISHFGLKKTDLPPNLSLSLGSATLTPIDLTIAWAVFANGGYKVDPYIIQSISDRDERTIYAASPAVTPQLAQTRKTDDPDSKPVLAEAVIDERTAYLMTDILKDVIKHGTGRRALSLKRTDLAGKTGTTNDSFDSWFIGYNYSLLTSVWAGFDQPETLGRREYGATISLPIWVDYMGQALADSPASNQPEPRGLSVLRVDRESGRLASANSANSYFELFKQEDTPPRMDEFSPVFDFGQDSGEAPAQTPQDNLFDLF